jgi:SAM-dependent methyltransferase
MPSFNRLKYVMKYLGKPPWDSGITPPELVRVAADLTPGKFVDIGCGTGTNVRYMAKLGWQVSGVDFVPRAIHLARRKLKSSGLLAEFLVGDVSRLGELPLSGPFNLALDMGCFHTVAGGDDRGRSYVDGLRKIMVQGGQYMLYVHMAPEARQEGPRYGVTHQQVLESFAEGFELAAYEPGEEGHWRSAWYDFRSL